MGSSRSAIDQRTIEPGSLPVVAGEDRMRA
jgi:hypothetical protein